MGITPGSAESLRVILAHPASCYDAATIERVAQRLLRAIEQVARQPEHDLRELGSPNRGTSGPVWYQRLHPIWRRTGTWSAELALPAPAIWRA